MNKKSISLILGIMCIFLTYGICVQIKTVNGAGTTVSTNTRENELRDAVLKEKEKYDNMLYEIERMEERLEKERANSTQSNTELAELENTIKSNNKILGLSEVTGEGIVITINDNQKKPSNAIDLLLYDPNSQIVHDLDLMKTVNELKNSGAEAISINGQRIIASTAIDCDGNVIKINGQKIAAPFEVKAIGNPASLLSICRLGGYVEVLESNGLEIKVETSDSLKEKITIPKYTGVIKFEYAKSE